MQSHAGRHPPFPFASIPQGGNVTSIDDTFSPPSIDHEGLRIPVAHAFYKDPHSIAPLSKFVGSREVEEMILSGEHQQANAPRF